jgi:hypothetical protein
MKREVVEAETQSFADTMAGIGADIDAEAGMAAAGVVAGGQGGQAVGSGSKLNFGSGSNWKNQTRLS